ncbi:MAG: hypothetical protein D6762_05190 [Candidatus Neomarinimicrobiota bacterium]|nr:MAG: hypothetical protein D6762_05190 [Candidatus Neomarinimicrobiota bacterium]
MHTNHGNPALTPSQAGRRAAGWLLILRVGLLASLALVSFPGCDPGGTDLISGPGTVHYLDLEGGFYGIITDDGDHLDPRNLPASYQIDSLRVQFKAETVPGAVTVHMWGRVVDLLWIRPLD